MVDHTYCFVIDLCRREFPTVHLHHRRGKTRFNCASNVRRRRRVKVDRAVADTRRADEEGVPRDDDGSRKRDARRRFKSRDVDRDVNSCFFPFFTNVSSRAESNAPRTRRFATPSARRKFDSASVARFWRRHARGAVRGVLVLGWNVLFAVHERLTNCWSVVQLQPELE